MTPEERAVAFIRELFGLKKTIHDPDVAFIAAAIRAAVQEEREACAMVADLLSSDWDYQPDEIAFAIRKRGER